MRIKFSLLLLLLIALLLLNKEVFTQDPNFHIYLCLGQSNMEGYPGTIQNQDKTVDSRFQVMEAVNCSNLGRSKGKWYPAIPPLCRCYTGLTPADYFGRKLVANLPSNIRVGVINVSVAGCGIELYNKANYQAYIATAPSWMINIINEYGGNPYGRLVEIAKLSQKNGVIKGILLHQGESNTGDTQWPLKVKRVYDDLINDLGLNADSIPLLAGEVVNTDQGGACASMNSIIDKLPQTIPNSYVISSKGCTDTTDNLHFNAAGYRELGRRYAVKMISLLGYDPNSTGIVNLKETIDDYILKQNYPNPFNPTTQINYSMPWSSHITLKVYNLLGQEVTTLFEGFRQQGNYIATFDASGLSSGIYLYRMTTENFTDTKKTILLK